VALTVGIATLLFDETGRARAGRETARAGVTAHRPAGPGGGQAARVSAAGPAEAVAPVARVPEVSGVAGAPGASSPAAAGALDLEGHHLLSEGRYPAAIDDLMRAIRASGRSLDGCMEPTSESCLTFAYALYDLGRALRLDDNPAAALPILTERLRIDNQRQVVQHELELARGAGT
jgi:tetratricopeptide (TPR) repeat protein